MALSKKQKEKIIEDLKNKIAEQKAMVLVSIAGLKVKDIFELRKKLKANEANLKVAKKSLIKKAFEENNLKDEFDQSKYKEEIALIFGFKDEILPSRIVYQFSKENKNLKILGGFIDKKLKEKEEIIALAQLPTRDELLAKMIDSLSAPMSNLTHALNYNIKGLITVLAKAKTK